MEIVFTVENYTSYYPALDITFSTPLSVLIDLHLVVVHQVLALVFEIPSRSSLCIPNRLAPIILFQRASASTCSKSRRLATSGGLKLGLTCRPFFTASAGKLSLGFRFQKDSVSCV